MISLHKLWKKSAQLPQNEKPRKALPPGFQTDIINFLSLADSDDLLIDDDIFFRELTVHMMMTEKPFIVCGLLFHFFQI